MWVHCKIELKNDTTFTSVSIIILTVSLSIKLDPIHRAYWSSCNWGCYCRNPSWTHGRAPRYFVPSSWCKIYSFSCCCWKTNDKQNNVRKSWKVERSISPRNPVIWLEQFPFVDAHNSLLSLRCSFELNLKFQKQFPSCQNHYYFRQSVTLPTTINGPTLLVGGTNIQSQCYFKSSHGNTSNRFERSSSDSIIVGSSFSDR